MDELPFDIYATVKPKTPEDIVTLCREALSELKIINDVLDELLEK